MTCNFYWRAKWNVHHVPSIEFHITISFTAREKFRMFTWNLSPSNGILSNDHIAGHKWQKIESLFIHIVAERFRWITVRQIERKISTTKKFGENAYTLMIMATSNDAINLFNKRVSCISLHKHTPMPIVVVGCSPLCVFIASKCFNYEILDDALYIEHALLQMYNVEDVSNF